MRMQIVYKQMPARAQLESGLGEQWSRPLDFVQRHKFAYLIGYLFTNQVNGLQGIMGYCKFQCILRLLKMPL